MAFRETNIIDMQILIRNEKYQFDCGYELLLKCLLGAIPFAR
jgi:hypothetical protein